PALCAPAEARAVRRHLAALLGHLRDAEAASAEPVTASEVVPSDWNLCTVAGVLLGYPAVYTFASAEGAENCLALTPLRVFTAQASCPRIKDGLRVQIYSFSVPESLCAELKEVLDAWCQELKEAFSAQDDFVDLCISSEVVSLPAVAL
ncbi:CA074 protein, partial [Mystacornis crossleyi]|nr:CA074 protein [Mystacornis crossleyi]